MSATWGTAQIGRLALTEGYRARFSFNMNTNQATLDLSGQESYPPLTREQWRARRESLGGMVGQFVQASFTNQSDLDGYYTVVDAGADATDWTRAANPGAVQSGYMDWTLRLEQVGPANAVDIESRVAAPGRANDYVQAGTRWHAPSVGAYGYTTGLGTAPSGSVSRPSADGTVIAYLGIPDGASPRWAASVTDYPKARARVSVGGIERAGTSTVAVSGSGWVLENGLIRVGQDAGGTVSLAAYGSAGWSAGTVWNIARGGSAAGNAIVPDAFSIIRNDYELCTVRILDTRSPGRNMIDLSLRRGSRFVEGYLQTDSSSTLAVLPASGVAGSNPGGSGYVAATGNDADGHRAIVGSARNFTALTASTGIQASASTALGFWMGKVVAGGSAISGDQAADLQAQYIGAMAERTIGMRR